MDIIAYWQKHCAPYLRAVFGRSERGAALVEYALLLALIAVVCIVALTTLGKQAVDKFSKVGGSIAAAGADSAVSRHQGTRRSEPRLAPSSRPGPVGRTIGPQQYRA